MKAFNFIVGFFKTLFSNEPDKRLNIIFFIDAAKTRHNRIPVKNLKWIFFAALGLFMWAGTSAYWIYSLQNDKTAMEKRLTDSLAALLVYEEKAQEGATTVAAIATIVAEENSVAPEDSSESDLDQGELVVESEPNLESGSQLKPELNSEPRPDTKPANNDKNFALMQQINTESKLDEFVSDAKVAPAAKYVASATKNVAPVAKKIATNTQTKITDANERPAKANVKKEEKVRKQVVFSPANSSSNNAEQVESTLSPDNRVLLASPRIQIKDEVITVLFSIQNVSKQRQDGYVATIAKYENKKGEVTFRSNPKSVIKNKETGSYEVLRYGYRFSIQRYKPKAFTFDAVIGDYYIKEVKIALVLPDGSGSETDLPIDVDFEEKQTSVAKKLKKPGAKVNVKSTTAKTSELSL